MMKRILSALRQRYTFLAAVVASLLATLYWGAIASDRYVSEARIIIQRTDLSNGQSFDIGGLLGNVSTNNHSDQLLLRDYLRSVDVLQKLDTKLSLRRHYSDTKRDLISRMWSEDEPLEWFYRHYLSRVSVEFDDQSGTLVIRAQAYDTKTAQAIATMLVEEGERYMNVLGHNLADVQVAFLDREVAEMNRRLVQAQQTLLNFQNREGLVSPQNTAENLVSIVNRLEGQLTDLKTRRTAMLSYLMPKSPTVVELNQQVAAVERQIERVKSQLTAPHDNSLNRVVDQYQRLQMSADFALDVYKSALAALEKGRVDATRTLKKVSVLQTPFEPQYAVEPRRVYNIIVFTLIALMIAGVLHLLAAVIRDHQD